MTTLQHFLVIAAALCLLLLGSAVRADREDCPEGWRRRRSQLRDARLQWYTEAPTPDCYNMTIEHVALCNGCAQAQNISVKNGAIQGPNPLDMPTVAELFRQVKERCFANCPDLGPAECEVTYQKDYGYIKHVYIDPSATISDEEFQYRISKVTFCG